MYIVVAFLTGVLGMAAGWIGLVLLVVSTLPMGNDGGGAMAAIFFMGPIGVVAGFVAGVLAFRRFGLARPAAPEGEPDPESAARRLSPPFAVVVTTLTAVLLGWAWSEVLR